MGFALSVFLTSLPAQQQVALLSAKQLKGLSVEELLQQEVVSISRKAEPLGTTAGSLFFLSGSSARTTGATSLPELLRLAPTLFVAQSSSSNWGVNARGFMRANAASNKLLVLIDGRTAYLPLYSNVFWDTTEVFLPDLGSIEVISGPSGSNWGANAVNGVINIQSRSAHETLGALVNVSAGTSGSQVAVREGFRVGAKGAVRVYAQHTEREATYSPTGADDDRDSAHSTLAGFRADWGNANDGEWTVQGEWQNGLYNTRPLDPVRNDAGHLLARWGRDLSPGSSIWVRAFYDYVLRNTNSNLTEETRTSDIEFQHTLAIGSRQHFLWGLNYRRIYDGARDSVGLVILPRDIWLDLGAVFAQHEITWHDGALRLTSGLRFEHNDFTGWEHQPTLRLAWLREKQTVWVAASRAVRTPSRIEKGFYAPAEPPYFIGGGPNFTSEVINAYELGWRGQLAKGASVTATVYHHEYDNLRSVEPTTPIVQANGVEGESTGLEVFMDYDVMPAWRLRAGGFVMNQKTSLKSWSGDFQGGNGEGSFPAHQIFLRNNFHVTPDINLWLSLRHTGEVPAYEDGGGVVPAYTELDATLGWQVRRELNVALVGRNLLDASHPEIGGLAIRREIQRSLAISLRWEF
jgi:iron complex outermembrane receptor protein